jgi:hypothetical protein
LTSLASCREEEKPCTEPVEYESVEPSHWGMLRHQAGDTLYFKKYEVKKDSGRRYIYIGEEMFVASAVDTPQIIYYRENYSSPCDYKVISHRLVQQFSGSQPIKCQLIPDGPFDDLQFIFLKKDFRMPNIRYNNPNSFFYEKLSIGSKQYLNVNYCAGYDSYPTGYKDSTMCFYNDDYGILKFIVNDALVYERFLK